MILMAQPPYCLCCYGFVPKSLILATSKASLSPLSKCGYRNMDEIKRRVHLYHQANQSFMRLANGWAVKFASSTRNMVTVMGVPHHASAHIFVVDTGMGYGRVQGRTSSLASTGNLLSSSTPLYNSVITSQPCKPTREPYEYRPT